MAGYVLLLVATSTSGLLTEGEFSRSDPCVRDLDSAACRAVPMIMTKSTERVFCVGVCMLRAGG